MGIKKYKTGNFKQVLISDIYDSILIEKNKLKIKNGKS